MKRIKMLAATTAAAAVVILALGGATASAAVPCKTTTTPCSSTYSSGITFHVELLIKWILKNEFKNVECNSATIHGHITFPPLGIKVTSWSLESCNCEVKVLNPGSLSISHISGTDNGTVSSSGTEITTSCSTIFGNVHCIYVTNNTDLGTLTGGNPAKIDMASADIPRLSTNALCDQSATISAEYKVSEPNPLYVEPE